MRHLFWLILLFTVAMPVFAQEIGPEAPILGKVVLGINGLGILEVALPTEYSYNPAAIPLALQIFKEKSYAEADYGILDFAKGPRVTNTWQLYAFQLKDGSALRLGRYTVSSNKRPIRYLGPDVNVEFRGETYEISFGRFVSPKASVGIAVIPHENIRTSLTVPGVTLASAEAKSDLHFRIGGLYLPSKKLSFGLVFTNDEIDASTRLSPELTGLPETVNLSGRYHERLLTGGVGYQPKEGSILFFSWQKGSIRGPNLDEGIDLKAYGVHQYLNPRLAVRFAVYDRVPGYEVTYSSRGWTLGASISKNTFRRAEEFLGRADTTYIWASKSW